LGDELVELFAAPFALSRVSTCYTSCLISLPVVPAPVCQNRWPRCLA